MITPRRMSKLFSDFLLTSQAQCMLVSFLFQKAINLQGQELVLRCDLGFRGTKLPGPLSR